MSKGMRSEPHLLFIQVLIMITFTRSLKRELVRAQEEIKRIQSVPLVIGQFMEAIDQKYNAHPFIFPAMSDTNTFETVPASYNHQQGPTMSFEFYLPSIANF